MDPVEPTPPGRVPLVAKVVVALVVAGAVAVSAFIIFSQSERDDALAMEEEVRVVLDEAFSRVTAPTWCEGGCSPTGDEWHADGEPGEIAAAVARALEEAGFEVTVEPGAPGAFLVKVDGPVLLDMGVTGPEWALAAPGSDGVAIWFTSVSVFDEDPQGVRS